jgi:hypothetical protein
MREISDRSPFPGSAQPSAPELPPIVEPSELRPRSSNPPAEPTADVTALPSIPPDAIVPDTHGPEGVELDFGPDGPQTPLLPTLADMEDARAEREKSLRPAPPPIDASVPTAAAPTAAPKSRSAAQLATRPRSSHGLVWVAVAFLVLCVAIAVTLAYGDSFPSLSPAAARPAGP